jgi:GTPase SAR1 family protein
MEKEVIVDGKVINLEVDFARIRSGTLRARRSSGVWEGPSTAGLIAASWSTISPTSAYGCLLMQSFDNIETWITEFLNQGAPKEPEKFPFILIGNKIDRE